MRSILRYREGALVLLALLGLAAGALLWWSDNASAAGIVWSVATVPVLLALFVEIVVALRRADIGLDVIAALSMSAALGFGEPLAANVVALMYAGGQLLERYAEGRARSEMTALLGRVARTAMRVRGELIEETPIEDIIPGDVLMIRHGEVVPVDGRVAAGEAAVLDMSALTGESMPQRIAAGAEVLSGATSAAAPFRLVAGRPAAESTYAGIVRLVKAAQESKAPIVRLADSYALGFLLVTVLMAGGAWWWSGDHLRALAVLVVATPCPLILAVPVAIMSGISRAAKSGVLVKNGGVFEALAGVRVAILDKTGTLTRGTAEVAEVRPAAGFADDDVLRLAASLDQASGHPVAATLVRAAQAAGIELASPSGVVELPGVGIEGVVEGRKVAVGGDRYVGERAGGDDPLALHPRDSVAATIAVAVDGRLAGVIVLEDRVRPDAAALIAALRAAGVRKVVLASGDRRAVAGAVGKDLGVDELLAEMTPADKIAAVHREAKFGRTMMVGDGINDAPALAAADVGVAMGARGATAPSQSAGIVVLVDELAPLVRAMAIARRTLAIAQQSVWAGLGLSLLAMVAAALGYLPPVQGALIQEAIDVAVILNALRALR
ncbi:MAG: cadmium-translocating P-type ATPase [Devosia nanyangense]|uniref:P-type Zn(2+) transporter n=1 Tax=Devosia nanyangense TaxID=1228055 RepID=A0A933L4J1_9HYPH|nr:cadmium-translocating P-type ATPase [Devosia nanyangense]